MSMEKNAEKNMPSKKMPMEKMSKNKCREKKVEAILTERKNVDPMICRKLQDVITKPV